jgi:ribosomal protein S24E|tara:strand:- start:129 stop:293 length:165 start_codon:yes stop_codon:yes gene_type:complete
MNVVIPNLISHYGKKRSFVNKIPNTGNYILSIENSYISERENKRKIKGAYELID